MIELQQRVVNDTDLSIMSDSGDVDPFEFCNLIIFQVLFAWIAYALASALASGKGVAQRVGAGSFAWARAFLLSKVVTRACAWR